MLTNSVADGGYGLDPEKFWATVYFDDDEAARLWREIAGLPAERIQRRGMADNYWSMGIPGPCGPSSEIYYDRGPEFGVDGGPSPTRTATSRSGTSCSCRTSAARAPTKDDFEILGPLPRKNIDTGMGVERVAFVLQGVHNVYETDLLRPVIDVVAARAPRRYDAGNHEDDVRYRIIADHSRTAAILIGDGVSPGNDGRGYVLRRLLRRVIRSAKLLGIDDPDRRRSDGHRARRDGPVVSGAGHRFRPDQPHRRRRGDRVQPHAGLGLASCSTRWPAPPKRTGATVVSGSDAFTLHDTYGFPIELTLEMAAEAGLTVDETGFRELMCNSASAPRPTPPRASTRTPT